MYPPLPQEEDKRFHQKFSNNGTEEQNQFDNEMLPQPFMYSEEGKSFFWRDEPKYDLGADESYSDR
jgi:hypothetical protein